MNRVAVFIDGNNVFHSARQLSFEINYQKLLKAILPEDSKLIRAHFYTGVDEAANRQKGFLHWMRRNGFRVVTKNVKVDPSSAVRRAHLEVEITTDMMEIAATGKVDTIIIISGDEDYTYPLMSISRLGIRVEAVGFKSAMANRILDVVDSFTDLTEMKEEIKKTGGTNFEDDDDNFVTVVGGNTNQRL